MLQQLKTTLIAFILLAGISASKAQAPVLIEKVDAKAGELTIPYEKWKLSNGLIVIIHEDHSDPLCMYK